MSAHKFQADCCEWAVKEGLVPILNAACKEDPANLAKRFGALNLDIVDYDPFTNVRLTDLKNFMQGDILEASKLFSPQFFGMVILGEFIEHAVQHAAEKALSEIRKIVHPSGSLALTFPRDSRPPSKQHAKDKLVVHVAGTTGQDITSWHQTVWTDEMLEGLFIKTGWREVYRTELQYGFTKDGGLGLRLEKR